VRRWNRLPFGAYEGGSDKILPLADPRGPSGARPFRRLLTHKGNTSPDTERMVVSPRTKRESFALAADAGQVVQAFVLARRDGTGGGIGRVGGVTRCGGQAHLRNFEFRLFAGSLAGQP
jgi:hypothetical protein